MIVLSELKCDTATRCICLYNSFGIVTILQQEILQGYKYIAGNEIPPQAEKRLCNALTIIRSLVSSPDLASRFLNSYILYYIGPLIESVNPRFVNIRKLCLAVYLEVSMHKDRNGDVMVSFSSQP
ncbi:hypothetical protein WA538_000922 [Blastocystis sp. DL]